MLSVDVDIIKRDMGYLSVIERPSAVPNSPSTKGHSSSSSRRSSASRGSSPASAVAVYSEPLSEGEEDDDAEYHPAKDEGKRTGLSGEDVKAAIAYREQMLKERREAEEENQTKREKGKGSEQEPEADILPEEREGEGEEPNGEQHRRHYHMRPQHKRYKSTTTKKIRGRALAIDPLAPSQAFDETLKSKLEGAQVREDERQLRVQEEQPSSSSSPQRNRTSGGPKRFRYGRRNDETEDNEEDDRPADEVEEEAALGFSKMRYANDRILERNVRAPAGKRISVPVRIEPKVYFAAERTFLVCSSIPPTVTSDSIRLFIRRHGSQMPFSSAQLLLLFSTSFLLKIHGGSSAQLSLHSLRFFP